MNDCASIARRCDTACKFSLSVSDWGFQDVLKGKSAQGLPQRKAFRLNNWQVGHLRTEDSGRYEGKTGRADEERMSK
jgi:hypothetical protein